jgi:hypothetical protein
MSRNRLISACRRGASSVEYMLVLALVVIPIALCAPMLMRMINGYSWRVIWVIRSPFG